MLSQEELAGMLYWYEIFFCEQLVGIIADKKLKGKKKSFFIPRKATELLRGERKSECPYYNFCNTVAANPNKFICKIESFDFMDKSNGSESLLSFEPDLKEDLSMDDFCCTLCPNRSILQVEDMEMLRVLRQKNEAVDKNKELSAKLVIRPVIGFSKKG